MDIKYTWKINSMETMDFDGKSNVVFVVHWTLEGTDGEYNAGYNGVSSFNPGDLSNFTPYENLTQEQVISWVKEHLESIEIPQYTDPDEEPKESMNKLQQVYANVDSIILNQKKPKLVVAALPW